MRIFLRIFNLWKKNVKGKETVLRGAKYLVPRGRNAEKENILVCGGKYNGEGKERKSIGN